MKPTIIVLLVALILPFIVAEEITCYEMTPDDHGLNRNTKKCNLADHRCYYEKTMDDNEHTQFCFNITTSKGVLKIENKCVKFMWPTDDGGEIPKLMYFCNTDKCNVAEACTTWIDSDELDATTTEAPEETTTSATARVKFDPFLFVSVIFAFAWLS